MLSVTYKIGGRVVCLDTWAAFHGVPPSTANTIDRKVRDGETVWRSKSSKEEAIAKRSLKTTLKEAATAWWSIRLGYYEAVVESGFITHPREICFVDMYNDEFVPEMRLLGHNWKRAPQPKLAAAEVEGPEMAEEGQLVDSLCMDVSPVSSEDEDDASGSRSTWYLGRNTALASLARQQIGEDAPPFKFKARANHSAYKECARCQTCRLSVQEGVQMKLSHNEIQRRKKAFRDHLQIMYGQRAALERLIQLNVSYKYLVENADKCGDQCLYLPASQRVSSENVSLYQYRIALQANVYAGKLFHLSLLLPNLTTGANFGITTELCGLVRMIQLGEVTEATRSFMRGVDGGSENINHASLGMNCMLVGPKTRRFDELQQTRLPPGHSHHYLTDGTFAIIEGWMTGAGFAGCDTLAELMAYLQKKFASASGYRDKRVEMSVLIVNFAFTKWFSGHLHMNKVTGIGDPLVWRHQWVEEEKRVLVQYKYLVSDEATFAKDEWGPWEERSISRNNPETGALEMVTVLRSDPAGVQLMASYPEIGDFPGVEEWMDEDKWHFYKVFDGMSKWSFKGGDGTSAKTFWDGMKCWHTSHKDAKSWTIGEPLQLGEGVSLSTTPTLSWSEMWAIIDLTASPLSSSATSSSNSSSMTTAPSFLDPLKPLDRDALQSSTDPAELNRVTHPGYTKAEQRAKRVASSTLGESYISENIDKEHALFFIKLGHKEGELAVGIGRRTFNSTADEPEKGSYEIEWFERKSKQHSWGRQPGFKPTRPTRRKVMQRSLEDIQDFIPLTVQATGYFGKPNDCSFSLTKHCMSALRSACEALAAGKGEGGGGSGGTAKSNKKSKRVVESSSEEEE